MKPQRCLVALLLLAGALAAPTAAQAAAPVKIRVAYGTLPSHVIPIIFANPEVTPNNGKTYTAELMAMPVSSVQLQAVAARELDIAWLAYISFASAVQNAKLDLRIVADILQYGVPGYFEGMWMALKSSGIQKPEDLKGKRIAVPALGTALDLALRATLEKHGLKPNQDYTLLEVNFPNMAPMLRQGKVDAAIIVHPWFLSEQAKGDLRELFGPSAGMDRIQALFFVARTEFLKEHRAAVQDFFTDYLRGLRWLLNPANRTAAVDLAVGLTKQKREVVDAFFLSPRDYFRDPDGRPDVESLQRNLDYLAAKGFIPRKLDVAPYMDLSFLDEARQRLR